MGAKKITCPSGTRFSRSIVSNVSQWLCWPFRPFGSLSTSFVPALVADPMS
jgi:hypothetical protein